MANADHVAIVKQGAETIRQWCVEYPDERFDLREANLQEADLREANLQSASLQSANLQGADLRNATLQGADLASADLRSATLREANLQGAHLGSANLQEADLREANLQNASLQSANLQGADLRSATLRGTNLASADLRGAHLKHADLNEANLSEANLDGVRNASQARALETVKLIPPFNEANTPKDAQYFDKCERLWLERWLDWEFLRIMGRLPLFGVSYTVLILIPIVFYGLDLYNAQVDLIRAWFEQVRTWTEQTPDLPIHIANLLKRLTPVVLDHLHTRPIPSQSLLLVVSTLLLALGATLYTVVCPSRIKEFSRTQWCDQFGHSLLHYWPLAWKYRSIRLLCALCYVLGGIGALLVLVRKVWRVLLFIYKNSSFSSFWW